MSESMTVGSLFSGIPLEASTSASSAQECASSGKSSAIHTHAQSSPGASPPQRSMPTCERSGQLGLLPSISSAADSPAKTSATPESALASTASARGSGVSTPESFANYDPATSSWRTSQRSLLGGWSEWSETWPRAGMTRSGIAYRLPPLVPLTDVTGFSLWPTPVVNDSRNGANETAARKPGGKHHSGTTLVDAVRLMYPTPTARDYRAPGTPERLARAQEESSRGQPLTEAVGGLLNPTWVEWLMGYPLGWTDLAVSGTRWFRKSLSGSVGASSHTPGKSK